MSLRTLGLVVARGGSKGIPRKNLRELAGRPLLAYTAEAVRGAKNLDRVVLSTDCEEIADVARSLDLDVPFQRPAELARDDTPSLPVVQHALRELADRGEHYDLVCLLQPTHPLRSAELIDRCVERLDPALCDSVFTVLPVPPTYNPHWVYFEGDDGDLRIATGDKEPIPRRQELPPAFAREGSVYVTRSEVVLDGSLYGLRSRGVEVDPRRSVNLDTEDDWLEAERLLAAAEPDAG